MAQIQTHALANLMIIWALVAWVITRWTIQSRVDAQVQDIKDDKMAIVLVVVLNVMTFYYILVLTALASLAVLYLVKFLLLDFFNIHFPQNVVSEMFSFVVSSQHIKFNLTIISIFLIFATITIVTSSNPSHEVLRSRIETLFVFFLIMYACAFIVFCI
jgi:hypothetical protein